LHTAQILVVKYK